MKTQKIYDGKRISRCAFLVQLQVPIFIRLGDIGEEREKNMSEKKRNYAKRAPQCLHMLRKAMLHGIKAIINVGVTKY